MVWHCDTIPRVLKSRRDSVSSQYFHDWVWAHTMKTIRYEFTPVWLGVSYEFTPPETQCELTIGCDELTPSVSSHPITVWAHIQSHRCEQNYIFVRLWINSCYYLLMRVKMSLWALSCVNSNENESVGGVTPSGFHGVSSHPITKMVWAHTGFLVVWTHT